MAVADQPRHGYAIIQNVAAATSGAMRLGAGTLYRSVQRMLEQGLIEELPAHRAPSHDDERRRYYRITRFGEAVARADTRRMAGLLRLARATRLARKAT
jgi:DNA-binding PadR family transcriptional regulator